MPCWHYLCPLVHAHAFYTCSHPSCPLASAYTLHTHLYLLTPFVPACTCSCLHTTYAYSHLLVPFIPIIFIHTYSCSSCPLVPAHTLCASLHLLMPSHYLCLLTPASAFYTNHIYSHLLMLFMPTCAFAPLSHHLLIAHGWQYQTILNGLACNLHNNCYSWSIFNTFPGNLQKRHYFCKTQNKA